MLKPKKRVLVLGALVAGGAAAGIVYAAIPSGNVISACYNPMNGYALRVIDARPRATDDHTPASNVYT